MQGVALEQHILVGLLHYDGALIGVAKDLVAGEAQVGRGLDIQLS
jgi:hypothetical protein